MSITTSKALALGLVCVGSYSCGNKCGDDLTFANANNYSYGGTVDIPVFETPSGVNIEICFDQLTDDIQCHDTDPATDIVNVGMTRVDLTPAEINQKIANDTLLAKDTTGYVDVRTDGKTCVNTQDMSFLGTPLDVPAEYFEGPTYLVFLSETTQPGVGNRMVVMLTPKDASVAKPRVDVQDGCGVLDFSADLTSADSKEVCPKTNTKVDWSEVDTNGLGSPFTPSAVDELMLAHYNDLTAAELEASFFDLELLADEIWTLQLIGDDNANLKDAVNADGEEFDAFESSGLYLLALNLTTSPNPAPKFLTVLTPVEE
jgi:hypothetical protein